MHKFNFIFSASLTIITFHLFSQGMVIQSKDFNAILNDFKKNESFKFAHNDLIKKGFKQGRNEESFYTDFDLLDTVSKQIIKMKCISIGYEQNKTGELALITKIENDKNSYSSLIYVSKDNIAEEFQILKAGNKNSFKRQVGPGSIWAEPDVPNFIIASNQAYVAIVFLGCLISSTNECSRACRREIRDCINEKNGAFKRAIDRINRTRDQTTAERNVRLQMRLARFGGEIFDCIGGMTCGYCFTWEVPDCIAYALRD